MLATFLLGQALVAPSEVHTIAVLPVPITANGTGTVAVERTVPSRA